MESRYKITPQMQEYDRMGITWLPYIMHCAVPNYSSEIVNTDSLAFRYSVKDGKAVGNFENRHKLPVSLLVGSSTVFGIGATGDGKTIPSFLNSATDHLWFNFGGRAFSSTQELLLFLFNHQRFKKISKCVILSGVNNLILFYLSRFYSKELGSFFYWNAYEKQMRKALLSKRERALKAMMEFMGGASKIYGDNPLVTRILDYERDRSDVMRVIEKDIRNWKIFSDALGFEFYYVLQPIASWVKRKISPEEETLFSTLDKIKTNSLNAFQSCLDPEHHAWYSKELRVICEALKVKFFDMNEMLSRDKLDGRWLFVDRIHLTDEGHKAVADALTREVI